MFPPRKLGRFFLVVVVIYAALMAPWPGVRSGYAYLFRRFGDVMFARFWFWPEAGVRFLDLESPEPGDAAPGATELRAGGVFDTAMELRSQRAPGKYGYLRASSRYVGYVPTVVLAALVLAAPVPWSRRVRGLLWGLLLVHAFIVLRLTLTLTANCFAAAKNYAVFHPSPFWRGVLTRVESVFSEDPTVSFVVPVLIWFLVSMRRGAWLPDRAETASTKA
jgi:hypothetical protein